MELSEMRRNIDAIDSEILKLLDRRFEIAVRARRLKSSTQDQLREENLISSIKKQSYNLLSREFSEELYVEILKESRRLQDEDLKLIGFQGEHGAYSDIAAKRFDPKLISIPCKEFVDVFDGVSKNYFDMGIVPVENSIEGQVTQVNDLLIKTELKIVGEIVLPVHHCLIALKEADYREIKVAYSHPQALAQCRGFLERNKIEGRPFYNTAGAAAMIAKERPLNAAVIASKLSAEIYDLKILKEQIEDSKFNKTRFLVISKDSSEELGDKCSITFKTSEKTGSLFKILEIFADECINLTRIESRTLRDDVDHVAFLLDFKGSDKDEHVFNTIERLKEKVSSFNFLGCYKESPANFR